MVIIAADADLASSQTAPPNELEQLTQAQPPLNESLRLSEAVAEALADLDDIVTELARIRGVEATGPVRASSRDRESLRAQLITMIEREYTPEEVANDEATLRFLGILRPDQSLLELTLSLLESQIAGYYDHEADEFFIIDDADPETVRMITAHELYHAIQDQVWDLSVVQGPNRKVTDIGLARAALIEGDATDVMIAHLLGGQPNPLAMRMMLSTMQQVDATSAGVDVPAVMWEQLVGPYTYGLEFVTAVRAAGGVEALNAAYLSPPQSSEQILHPERYLEGDEPVWLEFLPEVPEGFELLDDDIIGELTTSAWLRGLMSGLLSLSAIERGTDGWDGDRFRLYERGDELVAAWLFAMDSEADARALGAVLARTGDPLIGGAAVPMSELGTGELARWSSETAAGALLVVQRGDELLWVMSQGGGERTGSLASVDAFSLSVWDSVTRSAYPIEQVRGPASEAGEQPGRLERPAVDSE